MLVLSALCNSAQLEQFSSDLVNIYAVLKYSANFGALIYPTIIIFLLLKAYAFS